MKLHLSHTLSLAMMPCLNHDDRPTHFAWDFQECTEQEVAALLTEATQDRDSTVVNLMHLPAMDSIIHGIMSEHDLDIPEPTHDRVVLDIGDVMIVVKYRGRKLQDDDDVVPPTATLRYYKMTVLGAHVWEDTVVSHEPVEHTLG
jgi:hypothetical protein